MDMSEVPFLIAEAFLVTKSGKSIMDPGVRITADNIDQFRPTEGTIREAIQAIESLGFHVLTPGFTLSVHGPQSLFENVFQITFDTTKGYIQPQTPPIIPALLQDLVEGLEFSIPAQLFVSKRDLS